MVNFKVPKDSQDQTFEDDWLDGELFLISVFIQGYF